VHWNLLLDGMALLRNQGHRESARIPGELDAMPFCSLPARCEIG
jgi:hypothetical protein